MTQSSWNKINHHLPPPLVLYQISPSWGLSYPCWRPTVQETWPRHTAPVTACCFADRPALEWWASPQEWREEHNTLVHLSRLRNPQKRETGEGRTDWKQMMNFDNPSQQKWISGFHYFPGFFSSFYFPRKSPGTNQLGPAWVFHRCWNQILETMRTSFSEPESHHDLAPVSSWLSCSRLEKQLNRWWLTPFSGILETHQSTHWGMKKKREGGGRGIQKMWWREKKTGAEWAQEKTPQHGVMEAERPLPEGSWRAGWALTLSKRGREVPGKLRARSLLTKPVPRRRSFPRRFRRPARVKAFQIFMIALK